MYATCGSQRQGHTHGRVLPDLVHRIMGTRNSIMQEEGGVG